MKSDVKIKIGSFRKPNVENIHCGLLKKGFWNKQTTSDFLSGT